MPTDVVIIMIEFVHLCWGETRMLPLLPPAVRKLICQKSTSACETEERGIEREWEEK